MHAPDEMMRSGNQCDLLPLGILTLVRLEPLLEPRAPADTLPGRFDKQLANGRRALPSDPTKSVHAGGLILARHEPHVAADGSVVTEPSRIIQVRRDRLGRPDPDARDGSQQCDGWMPVGDGGQLSLDPRQTPIA